MPLGIFRATRKNLAERGESCIIRGMSPASQASAVSREPIRSLWIGDTLSAVERLCIASFLANGYPFHLYAYDEIGNVPSGADLRDARDILPKEKVFRYSSGAEIGSLAGFSNFFRWELLLTHGGWWVDMDVVCLRPFDFSEEVVFGNQNGDSAAVSVLRFPAGHPLSRDMVARCHRPFSPLSWSSPAERWRLFWRRFRQGNQPGSVKFSQTGPKLFGQAVAHHGLILFAHPQQCFYPVHWTEWRGVFDGTLADGMNRLNGAHAIHLWNELMRRENFDKNGRFPADSVFENLRAKFDPAP